MTANARLLPFDRFYFGRPYGSPPSVDLGLAVLHELAIYAEARAYEPESVPQDLDTRLDPKIAAMECWGRLAGPIPQPNGRRRKAERERELERVALMLAEAWAAAWSYTLHRTRKETAHLLGLTPRQLRTREALLERAVAYFGLDLQVRPDFLGRPPAPR